MENTKEILELVESQGKAWEEFKTTNDAIIKAKADGSSVADLQVKLDKINEDMAEQTKAFAEFEKKAGRPKIEAQGQELSAEKSEYKKAFSLYLRTGEGDPRELKELGRKAMNTGSDPDGGYLVEEYMDTQIDRIAQTQGGLAALANVITIGTAKYEKLVKTAGMSMRRVADGATGGETTEPKYSKVSIEVFPAEVEPWVYNETLEDAMIDLESDLAQEAGIAFAEGANAEYITGNGVGKARGIAAYTMVANSAYAWGSVGYVVSGKTADFASVAPSDKIINLQHSLKAQYRSGAYFLMNDATLAKVRQIKDASGNYYLWNPNPAAGFGGQLLGSPVQIDDNVADIGAGALALAFGNFRRGYTIVNRSGTGIIRDNITAKGTTKFNFRRRFGAGITNYEAIKWMKIATS